MALISTGTRADTIAHGAAVSNSSGQRGMMRVRTGSRIEYHDGTKWILDLSLPAFGNGTFTFTQGDGTKITKSGSTPTANLATSSTSTTSFAIDKTVTDEWVANRPPLGTIGWVDATIAVNPNNQTIFTSHNYSSVARLSKGQYRYTHVNVGAANNKVYSNANSTDVVVSPTSAANNTSTSYQVTYKNHDGDKRDPNYSAYFLAII